MFIYLPQPGNNLYIKAGDSVVLSNNARHARLDIVDDTVENNVDTVENNTETKISKRTRSKTIMQQQIMINGQHHRKRLDLKKALKRLESLI